MANMIFNFKKSLTIGLMSLALFGCQDMDRPELGDYPVDPDPYGGYKASDEVAAAHLVTKLSFDDNLTDSKTNITGMVGTKVAYAPGVKGNAYSGSSTENRYAIGNVTSKITGLNSFTISFWLNSANTVPDGGSPGQGKGAQGIFSIVRPSDFWGGINVFLENPDGAFPNRLRVKLGVENGRTGVVWGGQGAMINIDNNLNKWIHIVFTYNSTSSVVSAFVNGALAANLTGFAYAPSTGVAGSTTWYANDPGDINNKNNASKYGDFVMVRTNGKVVFGTHQFETNPPLNTGSDEPWATSLVGLMDEFRIYDMALKNEEVLALYNLEKDKK